MIKQLVAILLCTTSMLPSVEPPMLKLAEKCARPMKALGVQLLALKKNGTAERAIACGAANAMLWGTLYELSSMNSTASIYDQVDQGRNEEVVMTILKRDVSNLKERLAAEVKLLDTQKGVDDDESKTVITKTIQCLQDIHDSLDPAIEKVIANKRDRAQERQRSKDLEQKSMPEHQNPQEEDRAKDENKTPMP